MDFLTGLFNFNGEIISPADQDGIPLTYLGDLQDFQVSKEQNVLNGMPYFPVFGEKQICDEDGQLVKVPFCGWKRKMGTEVIEKIVLVYPSKAVSLT